MREGPGATCPILGVLGTNARVRPLSGPVEADDRLWILVETQIETNGQVETVEGWVAEEFVEEEEASGAQVAVGLSPSR